MATDWETLGRIADIAIPTLVGVNSPITFDQNSRILGYPTSSPVVVNIIEPNIIGTVNGVVARQMNGDIGLNDSDAKLLALVSQYGGSRTSELESAVHELADHDLASSRRVVAKQKLMTFLAGVAEKAGDIGIGILQSYIENRLGF